MNPQTPIVKPVEPAADSKPPAQAGNEPLVVEEAWNKFDVAVPYSVVAGLVVDINGNFPMLHRSANVRSAPNVWSVPSGLHEVGETLSDCFIREMMEELNLTVIPGSVTPVGVYENMPGDGWHWLINMVVGFTPSLEDLVNTEPDKHDEIFIANLYDARSEGYFSRFRKVHDSAVSWYETNLHKVIAEYERALVIPGSFSLASK